RTWSFFLKPIPSNQSESSTSVPILDFLCSAHVTQLCHISLEDTLAFASLTQHSSNHCLRIMRRKIVLCLLIYALWRDQSMFLPIEASVDQRTQYPWPFSHEFRRQVPVHLPFFQAQIARNHADTLFHGLAHVRQIRFVIAEHDQLAD